MVTPLLGAIECTETKGVDSTMGGMMGGFGSGFSSIGGFGLIGMISNLVITVGLILGLVLLIAWLWRRLAPGGQLLAVPERAAEAEMAVSLKGLLQARYARGEVTREQYQQMLTDLS
jgi:putative membrane protein